MMNTTIQKLFLRLLILMFLSVSLWSFSRGPANSQIAERLIPVTITKQLESDNGVIPVEIVCGKARLTTPNQLDGFDCRLKNNREKSVTAANATYSLVIERNGETTRETYYSTIETLGEAAFKGANKPIRAGEEVVIGPPGPISYPDAIIKGVEVGIDYVEFDDNTGLGPNVKGSQIINDIRAGAAKYRSWLAQKYRQNGRSLDTVVPLLQKEQPLPDELEFLNIYQEQGARAYRNSLRKKHQTHDGQEVERLLN